MQPALTWDRFLADRQRWTITCKQKQQWTVHRWVLQDRPARFPRLTDLIGAPVPDGLNGEAENEAGPRQIPRDGVPEEVEGVGPRLVALGLDAGGVGGDGEHVAVVEVLKAAHFTKSWRWTGKLDETHEEKQRNVQSEAGSVPKPMRMKDPTIMMTVWRVSV